MSINSNDECSIDLNFETCSEDRWLPLLKSVLGEN